MNLGGDEEEKALFEECMEPAVNAAIPKASRQVALPPLRPGPGMGDSTVEAAKGDLTPPAAVACHLWQ